MASYIAINNSEIDPDSPITADLMTKFRDNPLAVFTKDATVPASLRVGYNLLGRVATTSGSSLTLSGLDLSNSTFLVLTLEGVSSSVINANLLFGGVIVGQFFSTSATQTWTGMATVSLFNGITTGVSTNTAAGLSIVGNSGYTTASTSVTLSLSTGVFDAGAFAVYGIR